MLEFWRQVDWFLQSEKHCVLALVMRTSGSTPRKKGAQMVISEDHAMGTIGGGIGERQLIHVCQSLLKSGSIHQSLQLALDGEPAAPGMGICGGVMDLALWLIPAGTDLFAQSAAWHAQGKPVTWGLSAERFPFLSKESSVDGLNYPAPPTLLLFGGGHCGRALARITPTMDCHLVVIDDVEACREASNYPPGTSFARDCSELGELSDSTMAILLTRHFKQDVAILSYLSKQSMDFVGMMGSRQRVGHVLEACRQKGVSESFLAGVHAPVGMDIGAETPEEIAISILAQIIAHRHQTS